MWPFFSYLYPKIVRRNYAKLLQYYYLDYKIEYVLGVIFFFGTSVALLLSLLIAPLIETSGSKYMVFLYLFPVMLVLANIVMYYTLFIIAEKNGRFVENILPDALQLMASNLRAGMTIDRALLVSTRREFGPFNREMIRVGKEITTGQDIATALRSMTLRIKSFRLKFTVELIILGMRSGGELSQLLDQVAESLRQQHLIEEKIKASIVTYIIFIFAAACIGTPFLFGLSTFLIRIITANLSAIEVPETTGRLDLPFQISEVNIDPNFVVMYALIVMATSAIMASLVIGLIKKGKEKFGLQYIPLYLAVSFAIFFGIRFLLSTVFGGLLTV